LPLHVVAALRPLETPFFRQLLPVLLLELEVRVSLLELELPFVQLVAPVLAFASDEFAELAVRLPILELAVRWLLLEPAVRKSALALPLVEPVALAEYSDLPELLVLSALLERKPLAARPERRARLAELRPVSKSRLAPLVQPELRLQQEDSRRASGIGRELLVLLSGARAVELWLLTMAYLMKRL
jgi:hypothetical protein